MWLIDRLSAETEEYHAGADQDRALLRGPMAPGDYRRYLARMYGFVVPLERSIAGVRGLDRVIDPRRFRKGEKLRADLVALRFPPDALEALPRCTLPRFESVEEALGWAYPIERSTHEHTSLYRHLATNAPGDAAFASSYLRCYFGMIGESRNRYGDALEAVVDCDLTARRVIECARASFRAWRSWRAAQDALLSIPTEVSREQEPVRADGDVREEDGGAVRRRAAQGRALHPAARSRW